LDHLKFLLKHTSKNRKKLIIALGFLSFVSISNLVYPWLFKLMIDFLVNGNTKPGEINFPFLMGLLAGVMILSTIFGYYTNILMQELGFRLRNDVRNVYFRSLLNKPLAFFKDEQVGGLTSRATEDIGKLQGLYTGLLVPVYQNTLFIIGCLLLMLSLNPAATGIVFVIILCGLPAMYYFSKKIKIFSSESQREHAAANAVMDESLSGIRDVKAFLLERIRLKKYSLRSDSAFEKEMHSTRYQAKSTQSVFIIVSLMMLLIFFIGTSGGAAWSPGSAAAFYFYAYSLTMAFLSLGKAYTSYNSISGATAKIAELIGDDGNNIEDDAGNLIPLKGKIEFRNVDFSYSADKQVLKDVSFSAAEGEWLLITGPSGSGKSTIANLLLGFYKPSSGDVLVDGINIDGINSSELRNSIGFVGQEAVMFEGTIRENILISGKETDEKKLKEILETSMSGDFINRMPAGLDTNIAERGVTLSAGQRARLAIARALVLDPAILVLDEANSMLEESLEKELWENLYKARKNKTTIIFSHHTEAIPKVYKHFRLK